MHLVEINIANDSLLKKLQKSLIGIARSWQFSLNLPFWLCFDAFACCFGTSYLCIVAAFHSVVTEGYRQNELINAQTHGTAFHTVKSVTIN